MSDLIQKDLADRILTLTINRPDKKNALTVAMYAALAEAINAANDDPTPRVILITGSADSFTAGNDLKDFLENPPVGSASPVFQFMHAIAGAEKPVVAAVNGSAIGIGTTMLLHCDIVYAVGTARFQLPFVNLGLVPELGSSLVLPALAGRARAAELLMTGKIITGDEAAAMGLVSEALPREQVLARALETAHEIATHAAPVSVATSKRLLWSGITSSVSDMLRVETPLFSYISQQPDSVEGVESFLEHRDPQWKGSVNDSFPQDLLP